MEKKRQEKWCVFFIFHLGNIIIRVRILAGEMSVSVEKSDMNNASDQGRTSLSVLVLSSL